MKNPYRKLNTRNLSLADLIEAVASVAKNNSETVAAVADMINSGRVQIQTGRETKRLRVA